MTTRALLLTAALALTMTTSAEAATVTGSSDQCGIDCVFTAVSFVGSAGESNDVTLGLAGGRLVVTDTGAPLVAGGLCQQVTPNQASCDPANAVIVDVKDGNDRVTGTGVDFSVDLGPGDDRSSGSKQATGGDGADVLEGTAGPDVLDGGAGADVLTGAAGNDVLVAGEAGAAEADRVNGGDGVDLVSYAGSSQPVTLVLGATDPQPGLGGDELVSVEAAQGSAGDDRLTGDAGPNVLFGWGGEDVIDGAGGNDLVTGGAGYDELSGGDGDDLIDATSKVLNYSTSVDISAVPGYVTTEVEVEREPLHCGAGSDRVASEADLLYPGCEGRAIDAKVPILLPRFNGDALRFSVPCPKRLRTGGRCRGRLTLQDLDHGGSVSRAFRAGAKGARVQVPFGAFTIPFAFERHVVVILRYSTGGRARSRYGLGFPVGCDPRGTCF